MAAAGIRDTWSAAVERGRRYAVPSQDALKSLLVRLSARDLEAVNQSAERRGITQQALVMSLIREHLKAERKREQDRFDTGIDHDDDEEAAA